MSTMNQPTDLLRDGNAQPAETMDIAATMQRSANQLMDPRSQQFDPMAASAGIDEAMAQLARMTEAGPAIVEQEQAMYQRAIAEDALPGMPSVELPQDLEAEIRKYQRIAERGVAGPIQTLNPEIEAAIQREGLFGGVAPTAASFERINVAGDTVLGGNVDLDPRQRGVKALFDLRLLAERRKREETALKNGSYSAWINREIEKQAIRISETGGAGAAQVIGLSVPRGIVSGVQSLSGLAAFLGTGLDFWEDEVFGPVDGAGSNQSTFFNNLSATLEYIKEGASGTTDPNLQYLNAIGDGIGQLAVTMAIAYASGGAAIPAFVASGASQAIGSSYNQSYLEALRSGLDPETAKAVAAADAVMYGATSAVTQIIPANVIVGSVGRAAAQTLSKAAVMATMRKLSSSKELLRRVAGGAFAEGFQEVVEDAGGNAMQLLAWSASGGDPLGRELALKRLAEGDPEAWREALMNFVGGAAAGGVGGFVTKALDLRQYKQDLKSRNEAWKAINQGLGDNQRRLLNALGENGNPTKLSAIELLNIVAKNIPTRDQSGEFINPDRARAELKRRGIPVPPPAPVPAPAATAAPAPVPAAPTAKRHSIVDGPQIPAGSALEFSGLDVKKLASLDQTEIEKFVDQNKSVLALVLGRPGSYLSEVALKEMLADPAVSAEFAPVLATSDSRRAFMAALLRSAGRNSSPELAVFKDPGAVPQLNPVELARLNEIDSLVSDPALRPRGLDLIKIMSERAALMERFVFGVADKDLDPLTPYEKNVLLPRYEAALKDPAIEKDEKKRIEKILDMLRRRSASSRIYAPAPLPAIPYDPASKPLNASDRDRLDRAIESLTDGRPLTAMQRAKATEIYNKLSPRDQRKAPAPAAPAPAPAPAPAAPTAPAPAPAPAPAAPAPVPAPAPAPAPAAPAPVPAAPAPAPTPAPAAPLVASLSQGSQNIVRLAAAIAEMSDEDFDAFLEEMGGAASIYEELQQIGQDLPWDEFDAPSGLINEDGSDVSVSDVLTQLVTIFREKAGIEAPQAEEEIAAAETEAVAEPEAAPEPEPEPVKVKKRKELTAADLEAAGIPVESAPDVPTETERRWREENEAMARRNAERAASASSIADVLGVRDGTDTSPASVDTSLIPSKGINVAIPNAAGKPVVLSLTKDQTADVILKHSNANPGIFAKLKGGYIAQAARLGVFVLPLDQSKPSNQKVAGSFESEFVEVPVKVGSNGEISLASKANADVVLRIPAIRVSEGLVEPAGTIEHEAIHAMIRAYFMDNRRIREEMRDLVARMRAIAPRSIHALEYDITLKYPDGYKFSDEEIAVFVGQHLLESFALSPTELSSVLEEISAEASKADARDLWMSIAEFIQKALGKLGISSKFVDSRYLSKSLGELIKLVSNTDNFDAAKKLVLEYTSTMRPVFESSTIIREEMKLVSRPDERRLARPRAVVFDQSAGLSYGKYETASQSREMPAKRIGGKTLQVEGVSVVKMGSAPRLLVAEVMAAGRSSGVSAVSAAEKVVRDTQSSESGIKIDGEKIRSRDQYKRLSSAQKRVVDAILNAKYPVGDLFDAAMSYAGKMPKEIEAQIDAVVRSTGLTGKSKSTVEMLVRVKVNSIYAKYLLENSKKQDEGWEIPKITGISINKDGVLEIKTEKLGWDLDKNPGDVAGRPARVLEAAKNIADEVEAVAAAAENGDPDAQWIIKERAWYTNTMNLLSRAFGPQFVMFNELLAVFSPRTPADVNFNYAVEAIENFSKGLYDEMLSKYRDWLTDAKRISDVGRLEDERAKAFSEWKKSRSEGQSKSMDLFNKTPQGSELKRELDEKKNWNGKVPFRQYSLKIGDMFPYTPKVDSEGSPVDPKNPGRFTSLKAFVNKYGPKKEKGEPANSRRFIEAQREFINDLIRNNPDSFDSEGNLLDDATITFSPLFGPNSRQALDVMANIWAASRTNPKTPTFNANLLGTSLRATIDVWAARAVRWATGQKRIPPFAERAVAGKIEGNNLDMTTKDFGFGQVVFEQAAEMLTSRNLPGVGQIDAMNLQAVAWFMWKRRWNEAGWSSIPWRAGSFERSFAAQPMIAVDVEFDIDQSGTVVGEIVSDLKKDPGVVSISVSGDPSTENKTRNLSVVVRRRKFDTNAFASRIAAAAADSGSTRRVTVTQTLPLDIEKTDSSRIGVMAYFKRPKSEAEAMVAIRRISQRGWTFVPMYQARRAMDAKPVVVGVRAVYSAEADVVARRSVMFGDQRAESMDAVMLPALGRAMQAMMDNGLGQPAMYAVESVTYGPEGINHDEPGMAPFSDFRTVGTVSGQSVSASVAAASGIRTKLGRSPDSDGVFGANGPFDSSRTELNSEPPPTEVQRAHLDFARSAFPDLVPAPKSEPISMPGIQISEEPDGIRYSIPFPNPGSGKSMWSKLRNYFRFSAEGSNIRVEGGRNPGDLGQIRRWLTPTLNSAWSSGVPLVRKITETMVSLDLERQRVSSSAFSEAENLYEQLPKEYKKDNGRKFFELMDRLYDPNWDKTDRRWVDATGARLPESVIDVLVEFKRLGEEQRLGIISEKRDTMRVVVSRMKNDALVKIANENGAKWSVVPMQVVPGAPPVQVIIDDDTGDIFDTASAREAVVMLAVPDTWGRQFAHIYHGFFGSYEMIWFSKSAYEQAIASGLSDSEARKMAKRSVAMDGGTATEPTEARAVRRMVDFMDNPPLGISPDDIMDPTIRIDAHVPPDVVRLSGAQYDWLRRDIAEAADIESDVVSGLLRGKIGKMSGKKRFYASVLQRTGKAGFDMDFMQAWKAQTNGYYKWLYFNRMRRDTQDLIHLVRQSGYTGWANHLQENLEYTTSFQQTQFEQLLDGVIASMPIFRTMVGPMPSRRFLQMLRTANVYRQLMTGKQQIVNSLQPLQTVFPILGAKRMVKYIGRYNGRDGKALMAKYGYLKNQGSWYEGRDFESAVGNKPWFRRTWNGINRIYAKTLGRAIDSSAEARNQNFTFASFYWYATEELGMNDDDAARHALLRVAQTQFAYTKANTPVILRGPVRATLLQYKRFMLSSFGLAMNFATEKHPLTGEPMAPGLERAAIFGRWLSTFLVVGGLKGLPLFFVAPFLVQLLTGGEDDTNYDIHNSLREQLGEDYANIVLTGLPAAAGVDISGSIVLFPKPYGRTTYEMIGSFVAGPTVSAFLDVAKSVYDKNAVHQGNFEELYRGVYASSPAAQQLGSAYDMIAGEQAVYDTQGRLKFRKTAADQMRSIFGFRSTRETMESLEYEKVVAMKEAIEGILDDIATQLATGNIVEAQRAVANWNSLFPEAPIPSNIRRLMKQPDISKRVARKIDDRTLDTRQRRLKQVNNRLSKILVDRYGFEESDLE